MSATLPAAALWAQPWAALPRTGGRLVLDGARIAAVEDAPAAGDHLLVPGLVNAHDHGRGLRPLAVGAPDGPLEAWLWDLWRAPGVDPYLTAAVAFGQMALSGVTAVVHNHLPQSPDMVAEARAVARAARDVGLRLGFVVPVIDRNLAGYDGGAAVRAALPPGDWQALRAAQAQPPVAEQIAAVAEVARAIDGDGIVTQYGPPGPQWLSGDGLAAVGDAAARAGRRVHVHLLETAAQRAWMDAQHPQGAHMLFAQAGLLNDRLTVAHGVMLRADEIAALAQVGATLTLNTSSNLRLGSGIADGAALAAGGLRLGLGLDGMALADDADMLAELRLTAALLGPRGFAGQGLSRATAMRAAFRDGRVALDGQPAPGLVAGADADIVALSLDALAGDRLDDEPATLCALAFGRWSAPAVRGVWVAGRQIVADGRLTAIDLPAAEAELTAQARAARAAAPPPGWIARARAARVAAERVATERAGQGG